MSGEPRVSEPAPTMASDTPPRRKVLVVDDDPAMCLMVRATLEGAGFLVRDANGGGEALSVFETLHPDIVLLDVMMPDMDGFATCQALRRLPGGAHIPIVMLTGLDDSESIEKAYSAGATDFVTKPIAWPMLAHRVRYILRAADAFDALAQSRESLANAQRIAALGNWELHLGSGILRRSPEIDRIFGLGSDQSPATFEALLERVHGDDVEAVRQALAGALENGTAYDIDHRIVLPDGSLRYISQQAEVVRDDTGKSILFCGTAQDITDRKSAEDQIRFLTFYDALTGLPNHQWLREAFRHAAARAKRDNKLMAVLCLDLDHFKRINATLGHNVGDLLLAEVAHRLEASLRESDPIIRDGTQQPLRTLARLGGDEFTVLLSDVAQVADVAKVAHRLLATLARPCTLSGYEVSVTVSIGMAIYPIDAEEFDSLLKHADNAMYHAKAKGRNKAQFYTESMNANALERLNVETQLRKAVESEQFVLHYQPQVELASGRIVGAEALIRWQTGQADFVSPADFIPIAEDNGLIVPIGDWVLRTACAQAKAWLDAGLQPTGISVNLSARQFSDENLVQRVANALHKAGLGAHYLELELTESMLMQDAEPFMAKLDALKALGVKLALDDFGTGYSSLSYLKRMPFDRLKVDRSFICNVTADPNDAAIVRAIISMGQSLQLDVIAEGVETEDQARWLKRHGCQQMQGYYFSPAVAAHEFGELLRQRKRLSLESSDRDVEQAPVAVSLP